MNKKGILWTVVICVVFATIASAFMVSNFGMAIVDEENNKEPDTIYVMNTEPAIETEELTDNNKTDTTQKEPETIRPIDTKDTPKETGVVVKDNADNIIPEIEISPQTNTEKPKPSAKPEPPKPIEKLKPNGSYSAVDMSSYTAEEKELLNIVLEKVKNSTSHNLEEEIIYLDNHFTIESYYKVASYFYVYYGQRRAVDETFDIVNYQDSDGSHSRYVRMRYDDIREFEKELTKNKQKIDSILSTFNVGSEQEILRQIADYLQKNISYTDGYYDLSNALNGNSVCNGYALAFNAMANRAGITTDMCIGKVNGIYHAWNRVTLSDGSYRFYDITFYDSSGNTKYLHSKTSPHTNNYLINDYTACWFKY